VIIQALRMPRDQAQKSMSLLRSVVRRNDVTAWADSFIGALSE